MLKSFGSSIGGMAKSFGKLAAIGGIGSGIVGVFKGIGDAATEEQNRIAFTTLLQSAEKAKTVMSDVADFAASTPFQLPQLTDSAKSLAAFGFEADAIVPTLRRIGDISAGLGQPINEIAELYGKAKVQGRLFGEDINQLTGRGIPIISELAKQFGVNESKVKELVSAGKVGFPELEKAFQSMTGEGGKFAGLMEAQSGSLTGIFSTLKDNVSFVFKDIGQLLIDAFNFKGIASGSIEVVQSIRGMIAGIKPVVMQVITLFKMAWSTITAGATQLWNMLGIGSGATFQGMADKMLNFMIAVEFAFKNMGAFADLAWAKIQLGAVSFNEDMYHLFTVQIPEAVSWFGDNFREIMFTSIDYVLTVFQNLGKNIRSIWNATVDFFSGKGFNVDWTPLKEGFVSTIKELPNISERELTQVEKALGNKVKSMDADLGNRLAEFTEMRRAELLGTGEVAAETLAPQIPELGNELAGSISEGIKGAVEGPAALQRGSADAFSAILAAQRNDKDPMAEVAKNGAESVTIQKKTLSEIKSQNKNAPQLVMGDV